MKPEVKEQWVKALRGQRRMRGEDAGKKYTQTTGCLHLAGTSGFCCLGVLTDLYRQDTGNGEWCGLVDQAGFIEDGVDGVETGVLSPSVQVWAGLVGNTHGKLDRRGDHLSSLNDNGATFAHIADLIEHNL